MMMMMMMMMMHVEITMRERQLLCYESCTVHNFGNVKINTILMSSTKNNTASSLQMQVTTVALKAKVGINIDSKMPTVRNARSLVTSRELPSGLQIWGKRPLNALFSVATMNADTDSASEESVKVIQERVAHGTLYVRLTCPTMDNRHNKPSQVPEF